MEFFNKIILYANDPFLSFEKGNERSATKYFAISGSYRKLKTCVKGKIGLYSLSDWNSWISTISQGKKKKKAVCSLMSSTVILHYISVEMCARINPLCTLEAVGLYCAQKIGKKEELAMFKKEES